MKKVEEGKISKEEIDISREISRMDIDADFIKCVDTGKALMVLANSENTKKLIGRGGKNSKILSEKIGKPVRIIEAGEDKDVIGRILGVPVIGINIVYSVSEFYRIRIGRNFSHKIGKDMIPAVCKLLGKRYEIVFE